MKRMIIGLSAASVLLATAALAQEGPRGNDGGPRGGGHFERGGRAAMSPDDRAAFTDARIAALHAGLKLNADQEKLWPPVETAIRNLAKERQDAQAARRERFASMKDGAARNMPDALRFMADRQAASADVLRKLADASTPLYASLDDAQKQRASVLARGLVTPGMGGGQRHHGWHHHHGIR
jgi:zinc resistance-associated protein